MNELTPINFMYPAKTSKGYNYLVGATARGFQWPQADEELREIGYVITEEQYQAFNQIINQMIEVDIGVLQHLKVVQE